MDDPKLVHSLDEYPDHTCSERSQWDCKLLTKAINSTMGMVVVKSSLFLILLRSIFESKKLICKSSTTEMSQIDVLCSCNVIELSNLLILTLQPPIYGLYSEHLQKI
uniref:Uncharacterized protein n=1 Tax=Glossina brevipalpis TaxID=37001 RepID=A0A1A9WIK2_9MUSC